MTKKHCHRHNTPHRARSCGTDKGSELYSGSPPSINLRNRKGAIICKPISPESKGAAVKDLSSAPPRTPSDGKPSVQMKCKVNKKQAREKSVGIRSTGRRILINLIRRSPESYERHMLPGPFALMRMPHKQGGSRGGERFYRGLCCGLSSMLL